MRTKCVLTIGLLTLLGSTYAYAQLPVRANIPFEFTVAGKVLPAGEYQFFRESNDETIRIAPMAKGLGAQALVVTRLAGAIHTTAEDCHIVFDKVGDTHILSEVWYPVMDGFLLHVTKGAHEHRVVNVPR